MKKSIRVLLTMALTVAFVTPVFATETNLTAETNNIVDMQTKFGKEISVIVECDNNGTQKEKAVVHQLVDDATKAVLYNSVTEEKSYITFLNKALDNAVELEKVAKGRVDLLTNTVKTCPALQPQLDAAIVDYNKAVENRIAAQAAIPAAKDQFTNVNMSFLQAKEAKAANDADVIR